MVVSVVVAILALTRGGCRRWGRPRHQRYSSVKLCVRASHYESFSLLIPSNPRMEPTRGPDRSDRTA